MKVNLSDEILVDKLLNKEDMFYQFKKSKLKIRN